MKKFYNIFLTIAALAAVASCSQEEIAYEPGEPDVEGCYGVYFPTQEASGSHTYDPSQATKVDIEVARKEMKGEITVPYTIITDTPEIFKGSELKFNNGDANTVVTVEFDGAEQGKQYSFTIKIDDPQYASKYSEGVISLDFSVMRVEWKKFGEGSFTVYAPLTGGSTIKAELWYYEVGDTRTCKIVGGLPIAETDYLFSWNTKTNRLYVPAQYTGYVNGGLDIYVSDAEGFYSWYYSPSSLPAGYADWRDYCEKKEMLIAEYDGNGIFYLGDWYYYDCDTEKAGSGWQFGGDSVKDCDVFICDGFTRTDYSVELDCDYCEDGAVPVEFKLGADVAKVDYTVLPGELTKGQAEKAVEAIKDGTAENVSSATSDDFAFDEEDGFNYFDVEIALESESGDYTVVAVTYDGEDEAQESAYESFYFVASDDDDFDVDLNIAVEDTPARYESEDCTTQNSFKVTLWGSDLVDIKFAVYADATVQKYGYDAIVEDLRYEDEEQSYSLPESTVEAANTLEGASFIIDGLAANTKYWAFAWATNGTKATVVYAGYVTAGLPNEVIGEGHFDYNSTDTEGYEHGEEDLTLEFNPNDQTYILKDFYFETGDFSFKVDKDDNIGAASDYYAYLDLGGGYSAIVLEGADALKPEYWELCYGDGYSHYDEDASTYYFCTYWAVVAGGKQVGEYYGVDTFELNAEGELSAGKASFSFENMKKVTKGNLKDFHFSISEKYGSFEIESDAVRTVGFQSRAIARDSFEHRRPEISNHKLMEFGK